MMTIQEITAAAEAVEGQLAEAMELCGRLPDDLDGAQMSLVLHQEAEELEPTILWLRANERAVATADMAMELGCLQVNLEALGRDLVGRIQDLRYAVGATGGGPPIITLGDPA